MMEFLWKNLGNLFKYYDKKNFFYNKGKLELVFC